MPKVPVYDSRVSAQASGVGPVVNVAVQTAPGRAYQGLAESIGQSGNVLAKLALQRKVRENNIKALNLHTEYNEAVRQATDAKLGLQGSDAIGAYKSHADGLKAIRQDFEKRLQNDDEDLKLQFGQYAASTDEASLTQVVAHERRETDTARDMAVKNLVQAHADAMTARPDANKIQASLDEINSTIDLQYPKEQAQALKQEAAAQVKSSFILGYGETKPKEALTYLEDWKKTGEVDAKTYLALKTKLEAKGEEVALDRADAVLMAKHKGAWATMANDVAVNYKMYGLNVQQAEALSSRYEGHYNFNKVRAERAKAESADNEMSFIYKAWQDGSPQAIQKAFTLIANSKNMSLAQRMTASEALNGVSAQGVLDRIVSGQITTAAEVQLATMHMGAAGREVMAYFKNMKAADNEAIRQAVDLYKENVGKKGLHFKLPDETFRMHLIQQVNEKNMHGADILEYAKKTIGYKEEIDWMPDKIHSPWRDMEKNPKAKNAMQGGGAGKASNTAEVKINRLQQYDPTDVEAVRAALKAAYPEMTITDDHIQQTLLLNGAKPKGQ